MKNYYEILEVNNKASKEVIEKAYRVLAKKYHPDLYSYEEKIKNEKRLQELNEAYKILSDDFLREQYDKELEKQKRDIRKEQYEEERIQKAEKIKNQRYINQKTENTQDDYKRHKIGSFGSMMDLTRQLISIRSEKRKKKEITQKDVLAVALTIVVVLIIGVILWFIPFTNGWIRELIFENPLFSWMFSK